MSSLVNIIQKATFIYNKDGARHLAKRGFIYVPKFAKKVLFRLLIGSTIQAGPFHGMKYINESNGSAYFPKILGCYEKEIYQVIEKTINSDYHYLIDIGCAEGYYAVGFAYSSKSKNTFCVFAYDIDEKALHNLKRLAELNDVSNSIITKGLCTHVELNRFEKYKKESVFLICDIEGAEKELLDPIKAPVLLDFDMLIEIHDSDKKNPIIEKTLTDRFQNTHKISMIKCQERTYSDLIELKNISSLKRKLIDISFINEGRDYPTDWMFLHRK